MYKYQNRVAEYSKKIEKAEQSEIDPSEFTTRLVENVLPETKVKRK